MNIMEKFSLSGKVAIVTGGSKGLGRSMAIGLAQAGARVAVVSRSKKLIEETAEQIILNGGDAIAIPTDVTCEKDIERMTATVFEKFGRIDILVNNAGMRAGLEKLDRCISEEDAL